MNIIYYIDTIALSGGTLMAARHVSLLREMGHDAWLVTRNIDTDYAFPCGIMQVQRVEDIKQLSPDLIVLSKPRDIDRLAVLGVQRVFFCQGDDIGIYDSYIAKKSQLPKYKTWYGKIALKIQHILGRRKLMRLYNTPIPVWTVAPHLADILLQRNRQSATLIRNGIDLSIFHDRGRAVRNPDAPVRIISVGDYAQSAKNMPIAFEGIRLLKQQMPATFIRVAPNSIHDEETKSGLVDEAYVGLDAATLADLYRSADILLAASLDEGYSLAVLEAMACGCLCVLSDIPSFRGLSRIAPHINGDCAWYFKTTDPSDIAQKLSSATNNISTTACKNNSIQLARSLDFTTTTLDLAKAISTIARKS